MVITQKWMPCALWYAKQTNTNLMWVDYFPWFISNKVFTGDELYTTAMLQRMNFGVADNWRTIKTICTFD